MLFSHPGDFTPVCTTEFGMLSKLKGEFDARNCKIIGLSIDSVADHEAWLVDVNETQDTEVEFPVIADESGSVARTFGVIHPNAPGAVKGQITVRAVFLIDPQRRLQLHMCYAANTGRNFYEIIRCLDALQLTTACKAPFATPPPSASSGQSTASVAPAALGTLHVATTGDDATADGSAGEERKLKRPSMLRSATTARASSSARDLVAAHAAARGPTGSRTARAPGRAPRRPPRFR